MKRTNPPNSPPNRVANSPPLQQTFQTFPRSSVSAIKTSRSPSFSGSRDSVLVRRNSSKVGLTSSNSSLVSSNSSPALKFLNIINGVDPVEIASSPEPFYPGDEVGPYLLQRELGSGAFSTVFEARVFIFNLDQFAEGFTNIRYKNHKQDSKFKIIHIFIHN